MSDLLNIKLGVCTVKFNNVDLGHTIGGVEAGYAPEYQETKVDKYAGVAERWLIGEKLTAKVPLAESTYSNLNIAITHSNIHGGDYLTVGSNAGKRSSTYAAKLVLHPIANASNNYDDDLTIFKCHVTSEITLPYKNDGERIIEATFESLVEEGRGDGALLGMFGDSL